jgi:hypothetical protein
VIPHIWTLDPHLKSPLTNFHYFAKKSARGWKKCWGMKEKPNKGSFYEYLKYMNPFWHWVMEWELWLMNIGGMLTLYFHHVVWNMPHIHICGIITSNWSLGIIFVNNSSYDFRVERWVSPLGNKQWPYRPYNEDLWPVFNT